MKHSLHFCTSAARAALCILLCAVLLFAGPVSAYAVDALFPLMQWITII